MSGSRQGRTVSALHDGPVFLLIASPELSEHNRARPPVDVFTSEGGAREAFHRLRLRGGASSGWAQLVAVNDDVARPLCWFGRPRQPLVSPRVGRKGDAAGGPLGALAATWCDRGRRTVR